MKKYLLLILIFLLSFNDANAMGLFYTNATYPLTATGAKVDNLDELKKGTSSSNNILFLIEIGDAGIDTAAKKGNIKKISYVDVHEKNIFIFWRKVLVTVYGE